MSEFGIVIPGNPPGVNHTYRVFTVNGKARVSKRRDVESWQAAVAFLVRSVKPSGWTPSRRVRVEVQWWTARAHDADAGLKALLDGLAVGLDINDKCFLPTVLSNEVDKANPRTEVTIRNEDP